MVEKTVEKTVARTSLGVVKTSLGVMKTSLGVVKTSLEVVKTSLEVVKTSLGKACYANHSSSASRSSSAISQSSSVSSPKSSRGSAAPLMLSPGVESTAFPISSSQVEAVSPGPLFQGKFHLQSGSVGRYKHSITQPHDFVRLSLLELKEHVGYRL